MSSYKDLQTKIFERDNYTCRYCGKNSREYRALVMAHIRTASMCGDDRESNLITLCRHCYNHISKSGIDYQALYNQLYGELEMTAHCSLKRLQDNKVARMEKAGNTKTAIKAVTTKIAVIYDKPQLKAIFENIVKRYAMKYCA